MIPGRSDSWNMTQSSPGWLPHVQCPDFRYGTRHPVVEQGGNRIRRVDDMVCMAFK